jgi:dTDP-4-dehydrorhamnose 3,5-epimerase
MIEGRRVRAFEDTRDDVQTVTSTGESVQELIDGVVLRRSPTQADERGELTEIYDERWGFTSEEVTYAYFMTLRPGAVRGWSVHLRQADRLFFASGALKVALYDGRENSWSYDRVNVFFLGTHDRALLRIPPGVYHAVKNVGLADAVLVNLPTLPYDHANPDKRRLPVDSDAIPYRM